MKVLLVVSALLAAAAVARGSVAHYAGWHPAAYVSSYTTARELPSYIVPESTTVTTASQHVYRVPVTVEHTVAQPLLTCTYTYGNSYPAYHSSYPSYHSSYSYAPAWNYARAW